MKLLNFLIIKLTICLVAGILIGYYFPMPWKIVCKVIFGGILLLGIAFLMVHAKVRQAPFFGVLTCFLVIAIGVLSITFHTQKNQLQHYSYQLTEEATEELQIRIYKKLKPNSFYNKFLAKVVAVNSHKVNGILLVNVDSTAQVVIGDVFHVVTHLQEIKKPLNPHQFDFKAYMMKQQVYHQMYFNNTNAMLLASESTIYRSAADIRNRINHTLSQYSISKENLSIINALLLGQRQDVSKETYKSFTQSGSIHILAISGLHIGLLLLMLSILFKPFSYFRFGKIITPIIIILLLWMYAFIVGMSASVVRAVTMFSLVTIAIYSNRITNTYNTLVISAFLLLLCNPYYVFDVGFQLSYSAVFAIVWIKPLFDSLWAPENYFTRKFWDVFSVTLAAQLGILPLSLFYFHQFPGLFFVSNMVIIPLLGILLGLGIVTLVFAYFGWIPEMLLLVFNESISLLNNFVTFVADKEDFIFTKIPFNTLNLVVTYILLFSLVFLWKHFNYKRVVFMLSSILCIQLVFMYNKRSSQTEEFVIFNQYKTTLFGHKTRGEFNYAAKNLTYLQSLDNYVVNEFIDKVKQDSLRNVYVFKDKKLLVVDENSIYTISFKPDVVLLTNSPKLNLNRLIAVMRPELVVVDNNNYKSYVARWKTTCLKKGIPFHSVREEGAFVLK